MWFSKAAAQSKDQHIPVLFCPVEVALVSHWVEETSEVATASQQCGAGTGEMEGRARKHQSWCFCPAGEPETLISTNDSCPL